MFYLVAGRAILVETYDDWSSLAVAAIFSNWFLTPLQVTTKAPETTIAIRCGVSPPTIPPGLASFEITHGGTCFTDDSHYYVTFGQSLISFGSAAEPRIQLWIDQQYELSSDILVHLISHALSPALRRCGVFELHSAGVVPPEGAKTILLAGPSGSGKSTLTYLLAGSGWGYLSDDILLLHGTAERIRVDAFRRFFALTADTIPAASLNYVARKNFKARLAPQDHFPSTQIQQAEAGTLVFPSITRDKASRIRSLTPVEAMRRLLRLCPWASYDKPTSVRHLQMLGWLANSVPAYDLLAGEEILENPKVATKLLDQVLDEAG